MHPGHGSAVSALEAEASAFEERAAQCWRKAMIHAAAEKVLLAEAARLRAMLPDPCAGGVPSLAAGSSPMNLAAASRAPSAGVPKAVPA
jgi:hypothetical protein